MNGELFQIASIVAAGKRAIQLSKPITYQPEKYVKRIRFAFLPRRSIFGTKNYIAPDVSVWFERIIKNGVQDIKLLCPYSAEKRELLGFANSTGSSAVCFHKSGKVTYFIPKWQFDAVNKQWDVLYSEYESTNPPSGKLRFENNTDSFRKSLSAIKDLAHELECEYYAGVFASAIDILDGIGDVPDRKWELPQIPQQNLPLFEAAEVADVFGAMGSWNDEPSYIAHEKGMEKEYNERSDELLKNVRLAVLYAINEW